LHAEFFFGKVSFDQQYIANSSVEVCFV